MAENKTKLKLDALPEQIRDSMRDFADTRCGKGLGGHRCCFAAKARPGS